MLVVTPMTFAISFIPSSKLSWYSESVRGSCSLSACYTIVVSHDQLATYIFEIFIVQLVYLIACLVSVPMHIVNMVSTPHGFEMAQGVISDDETIK